jgi:hypothetical protein
MQPLYFFTELGQARLVRIALPDGCVLVRVLFKCIPQLCGD